MANETFFRLLNGRPEPDQTFDAALIPSSDEKAAMAGTSGTPAAANEFVTNTDPRLPTQAQNDALLGAGGFTPSSADPFAVQSYVDQEVSNLSVGITWLDAADFGVQYRKTTTGAPAAAAGYTIGEKVLNTVDFDIYTNTDGTNWSAASALASGETVIHWEDGDNLSPTGLVRLANDTFSEFNGASLDNTAPVDGHARCVLDQDKKIVYNGTEWVVLESLQQHNALSSIQGGTAGEFNHLTSDEKDAIDGAGLTASNAVLSPQDLDRYGEAHIFAFVGGFPANTASVLFEQTGALDKIIALTAGSITKVVLSINGANPSAGTLSLKLQINGVDVTSSALDLVFDNSTTNNHEKASTAIGTANLIVAATDTIGVELTSSAAWDQTTADLTVQVHVVYET